MGKLITVIGVCRIYAYYTYEIKLKRLARTKDRMFKTCNYQ